LSLKLETWKRNEEEFRFKMAQSSKAAEGEPEGFIYNVVGYNSSFR